MKAVPDPVALVQVVNVTSRSRANRALESSWDSNWHRLGCVPGWFDAIGRIFDHCELAARSRNPVIPWREPVRATRQGAQAR